MSIKYINRVLDLELTPVAKLVMAVLADNADDQGICWPRMSRIAARASVSERTAQRTKSKLVRQGLLKVSVRQRKDGSRMSDEYQLFPMDPLEGDNLSPPPPPPSAPPGTEMSAGGDRVVTPRTATKTSNESPPQQTDGSGVGSKVEIPECFKAASQESVLGLIANLQPEMQQQLLDEVDENYRQQPAKTVPLRLLRYLTGLAKLGQFQPELSFQAAERRAARRRVEKVAAPPPPKAERSPEVVAEARKKLARIRGEIASKGQLGIPILDALASCVPARVSIDEPEKG
jgi:hypothetical protein